ncbi:MAG: N-acetyl-D-Glu racemase DgcA [Parasphingorhabdus sp.]
MKRKVSTFIEKWPLKKPFIISRSARTETSTITVSIQDGIHLGWGECVPNIRYGESIDSTIEQMKTIERELSDGLNREELNDIMPAGTARNAIDCALWDLDAKLAEKDVGTMNDLDWPVDVETVQTISILSPQKMYEEAQALAGFPIIKVKMNSEQVLERIRAVHAGAPNSRLLIDANESWTIELLKQVTPDLADLNVKMIEQPLHADDDQTLIGYHSQLPIFADESCHLASDLPALKNKYQGINIKLDKTGGLTEAIALEKAAYRQGYQIMVGCMLSTSLGIAPVLFVARRAQFVDIDAPALLEKDRKHGIQINQGKASTLNPLLWGGS